MLLGNVVAGAIPKFVDNVIVNVVVQERADRGLSVAIKFRPSGHPESRAPPDKYIRYKRNNYHCRSDDHSLRLLHLPALSKRGLVG